MKKIIISSNTSWSIYNFRLSLIKKLRSSGYDVIIVAPFDEYTEKLKKENFKCYNIHINAKGVDPVEDFKTLFSFFSIYKKLNPDVVINYTVKCNIYSTIAAHFFKVKTINIITGLGTIFVKKNFITKLVQFLYRMSIKKSEKVFFLNSDDFHDFKNKKLVVEDNAGILPSEGVDTCAFSPINYNKSDDVFKFLLIARMIWDKGIGEYVKAAEIIKSRNSNVEFQLLGPLNVSNRTAISEAQIQKWVDDGFVNYLGATDNVKEVIGKSDCIVLPSYYREGVPRALLESASMEKPIITTRVPGCKDVVEDGVNGFLCNPNDVHDLVEKMERILSMSDKERKLMGENGRKKVKSEFDERIIIQKIFAVIESSVNNPE